LPSSWPYRRRRPARMHTHPAKRIPRESKCCASAGTNKCARCATVRAHAWWSPRVRKDFARARKS
jgi:hypothetical protein